MHFFYSAVLRYIRIIRSICRDVHGTRFHIVEYESKLCCCLWTASVSYAMYTVIVLTYIGVLVNKAANKTKKGIAILFDCVFHLIYCVDMRMASTNWNRIPLMPCQEWSITHGCNLFTRFNVHQRKYRKRMQWKKEIRGDKDRKRPKILSHRNDYPLMCYDSLRTFNVRQQFASAI